MCGDGANDAPALRQAQLGIAVSAATDVAKAAAGVVLTEPGLGGIVACIKEGRSAFQRVLTYTLMILVNKCVTLIVLGVGLIITGHAVLTPFLQALAMLTNDFVTMSRTADQCAAIAISKHLARPQSHARRHPARSIQAALFGSNPEFGLVHARPEPRTDADIDLRHAWLCRARQCVRSARTRPFVELASGFDHGAGVGKRCRSDGLPCRLWHFHQSAADLGHWIVARHDTGLHLGDGYDQVGGFRSVAYRLI